MNDPRVITAPAGYIYLDDDMLGTLARAGVSNARIQAMRETRETLIASGAVVLA